MRNEDRRVPLVRLFALDHLAVSPFFQFRGTVGEPRVKRMQKAITMEQNAATIMQAPSRGTDAVWLSFNVFKIKFHCTHHCKHTAGHNAAFLAC